MAQCPAHDDNTPSLSITYGEGCVALYCFSGCQLTDILNALDYNIKDLWDEHATNNIINLEEAMNTFLKYMQNTKDNNEFLVSMNR